MTITYQCRFIQGRSTVLTKCNFGLFGVLLCSGVEVVIKDLGDCNEKVGDCNVDWYAWLSWVCKKKKRKTLTNEPFNAGHFLHFKLPSAGYFITHIIKVSFVFKFAAKILYINWLLVPFYTVSYPPWSWKQVSLLQSYIPIPRLVMNPLFASSSTTPTTTFPLANNFSGSGLVVSGCKGRTRILVVGFPPCQYTLPSVINLMHTLPYPLLFTLWACTVLDEPQWSLLSLGDVFMWSVGWLNPERV